MNMKNYPIISIIIPIYNGEKYLKRCLESVLIPFYINILFSQIYFIDVWPSLFNLSFNLGESNIWSFRL